MAGVSGTAGADLVEPLIAILAVGALLAVGRWASGPAAAPASTARGATRDFGLLVAVVTVDTPAEVARFRMALRAWGIRSTWAAAPPGPLRIDAAGRIITRPRERRHVLVFRSDAARAARALCGGSGPRGSRGPSAGPDGPSGPD